MFFTIKQRILLRGYLSSVGALINDILYEICVTCHRLNALYYQI